MPTIVWPFSRFRREGYCSLHGIALKRLALPAVSFTQATITEISDATDVDLRKGRDEDVLEMLMANPKVWLP